MEGQLVKRPGIECIGVCFLWQKFSEKSEVCFLVVERRHCRLRNQIFFYFLSQQVSWKTFVTIVLLIVITALILVIEMNLWNIASTSVFTFTRPWMSSQQVQWCAELHYNSILTKKFSIEIYSSAHNLNGECLEKGFYREKLLIEKKWNKSFMCYT